jgi:hypothetical protein
LLPPTGDLRANWYNIYSWIASGYDPQPYTGKVAIFWSKEDHWHFARWKKLVAAGKGEVGVYNMPSDSFSSRTKDVSVLAEYLRDCLCKTEVARLD